LPSSAQAPAKLSWAGNKQNLLFNICWATLGELIFFYWKTSSIFYQIKEYLNFSKPQFNLSLAQLNPSLTTFIVDAELAAAESELRPSQPATISPYFTIQCRVATPTFTLARIEGQL
jgi:hypothetical protein